MQDALMYLIENNKYYRTNGAHLNQEALNQLPEDANLTDVSTLDLLVSEASKEQYEAYLST